MTEPLKNIWAGCDVDRRVKLFRVVDGRTEPLTHEQWLAVLAAIGAEPGEMLVVKLERETRP